MFINILHPILSLLIFGHTLNLMEQISSWVLLAIVILLIGLVVMIIIVTRKAKKAIETDSFWGTLLINIGQAIDHKQKMDKQPKPLTLPERKRNEFHNISPKSFYYIDKDEIELLSPQINSGLITKSVTTRNSKGESMSAKGGVKKVASVGTKSNTENEVVTEYVVLDDIVSKYNSIESFLLEKDILKFGFENFDFDENALNSFNRDCGIMQNVYGFEITIEQQEEHWKKIKKDAAYSYLNQLVDISGYVSLQSEFLVRELNDESCVLELNHDVNEFLEENDKINLKVIGSSRHLTQSAKRILTIGKNIQIVCVGKVIRWEPSSRTIEISPIAIY